MTTKTKAKVGRPSVYTKALGNRLCQRIADGESLRAICGADDMPAKSTVLAWLLDGEHKEFSDQYARAREIQAELLADEVMDISDDGTNDWMERATKKGGVEIVFDHEHVQRSKLRVDSRKWYLSKVLPKKFGERAALEVSNPNGGPVAVMPIPTFATAKEFAEWVRSQQPPSGKR